MEIHAYDSEYTALAQRVMGDMFDFAIVSLGILPEVFSDIFIHSDAACQIAAGNPAYIAGRNGCEIARMVLDSSGIEWEDRPDEMYSDKSPEYWAGWALAYYQWKSGRKFADILEVIPLTDIIAMYDPYHEMDIDHFADAADARLHETMTMTRLQFYRKNYDLSQSELARRSGVAIRQIQLFEQRQRDINRTQADTLLRLSKALDCAMEDLLEY